MGAPDLAGLVGLSRRYGGDPAWVLAGGGNTSWKDASTLWVKASGTALATIDAAGFCAMDRGRLDAIWSRSYPADVEAREAAALADLMAARLPGESKRPSVETLMHGFFPQAYVAHTHPALVNGMTCGLEGERAFRELFAEEAIWVPFVDPGYVLALAVKDAFDAFRARKGRVPALLFLQNHGLLVAAEDGAGIEALSDRVTARLGGRIRRRPDRGVVAVEAGLVTSTVSRIASLAAPGTAVLHRADSDILAFTASAAAFAPIAAAFSPDHIVYAGHEFLLAEDPAGIPAAWSAYRARNGADPRIVLVRGQGAFAMGQDAARAHPAMELFVDACAVAVYAESFGGALHMGPEKVQFIRNWEVERYRAAAGQTG